MKISQSAPRISATRLARREENGARITASAVMPQQSCQELCQIGYAICKAAGGEPYCSVAYQICLAAC